MAFFIEARDISERWQMEELLEKKVKLFTILNTIISLTNQADDLPQLLQSVLKESLHLLDFDAGGVYLVNRSFRTAEIIHSCNLPEEFLGEFRTVPIDEKPYDVVFIENKPMIWNNSTHIHSDIPKADGFLSIASFPLLSKDIAVGALNIASTRRYDFSEEEIQTLCSIGRELGSTIERMAAEAEGKKSLKNFETLFNSIDDMVFVLDLQGCILTANKTALNSLGYSLDELIGSDVRLLHVPERRQEALHIVQEMIAGRVDSCPVPLLTKDNNRIEVETKVTHGWWNNHEVLFGVSRDITERKKADRAIAQIRSNYESFLNTIDEFLFVLDGEGKILFTNDTVVRRLGFTKDELFGQSVLMVHPPDRQEEAILYIQKMLTGSGDFCPVPLITKNNSQITVETRVVRGEWDGQGVLFGVSKDVTQLKLSEEKFSAAFHASPALMAITAERDGRFIDINDTFLEVIGFSRQEVVGKTGFDLHIFVDPEDRQVALSHLHTYGKVRNYEVCVRQKDGTIRTGLFSIDQIHIGIEPCLLTTFNDITELKHAEQVITESEKKFVLIFEESPAPLLILNTQFQIIDANRGFKKFFGYSDEHIIGRGLRELDLSSAYGDLETILTQSLTDGTDCRREMTFTTQAGIPAITEVAVSRMMLEGEVRILVQIHDIDEMRRTQEAALREKNTFLENLITRANTPIIIWDPLFRITRLNPACEQLIGRSAEEVVGKPLRILFPPDQKEHSMRLLHTTLEGVRWETVEIDVMHRNGSVRTILWNSSTLYTPDGYTPIATIAQGRDVTREKMLEGENSVAIKQIQKNLAQLAILNDEIRNPLMIIMAYAGMNGTTGTGDIINDQVLRINDMVNHLDQRWIESEKVLGAIQKHYQIRTSHSPGQERHEENDSSHGSTWASKESAPDRRKSILIEEVQGQLYSILDSIDDLVYVADMDSHELLFINRYGRHTFGDIHGQKCFQLIHQDLDSPCPFCTNHLLVDESAPTGVHRWEYQNSWNGRWYECRDRAIWWSDGRLVRLEIATDITDRKQVEEELIRKSSELISRNTDLEEVRRELAALNEDLENRILLRTREIEQLLSQKEQFIDIISHDLKTPLTPMCALLPHLLKIEENPQSREILAMLNEEAISMHEMIDKILLMARVNHGSAYRDLKTLNVKEIVDKTIKNHSYSIQEKELVIHNRLDDDFSVYMNTLHLEVLIRNILGNAIKYTGNTGVITISGTGDADSRTLCISDTGVGMSSEEIAQIFDKFYQADSSRNDRNSHGMGLSFVKKIVDLYQGTILVESQGIGMGSAFHVRLPR